MKKNKLSLLSSIFLLVGGMIGSAIFSLSGITIEKAGPSAIISWIIAAFVMFSYALICSELAVRFPKSGGVFVFPSKALGKNEKEGEFFGFISTFGYINSNCIAIAFSAIYIGTYLSVAFPSFSNMQIPIAIVAILFILLMNYIKITSNGKINAIMVIFLIIILVTIIYISFSSNEWNINLLKPFFTQGTNGSFGFMSAVPTAMIGYGAVVAICFMVEEIESPRKNIIKSIAISLIIVALLYALVIFSVVGLMDANTLKIKHYTYIPLYGVAFEIFKNNTFLPKIISIAAILALLTTMSITMLLGSRALKAIADAKIFPNILSKESKNNTPIFASIVLSIVAIILSLFPNFVSYIVSFAVLFETITITLNIFSLIKSRKKIDKGEIVLSEKDFRLPFGLFFPIIVLIILILCYIPDIISGGWKVFIFSAIWYTIAIIIFKFRKKNENFNIIIEGLVIHGRGKGKTVGMPTANIKYDIKDKLPKEGVYATEIYIDDEKFFGATNVGLRPSVDKDEDITIETNIINFDRDIYDKKIKIKFLELIRDVTKFNSIEEVKKQVDKDKEYILSKYMKE
ncbi:MAG: amino acid permease [Eubacteriales bacterium]|nr:amino acid permease [Eubacteriales bacterium]